MTAGAANGVGASGSGRAASRFGFLAAAAVVATVPFAVPALWDYIQMVLGMERGLYLVKPVTNQLFFVQFGLLAVALPYCLWRALAPPRAFPANSIQLFVLALAALQIASAFVSDSPGATFRALLVPAAFVSMFFLVQTLELGRDEIEKFYLVALAGAFVACAYAVAQSQGYEFLPYNMDDLTAKQRVSSTLGHPNYLSSFVAPLAPWALFFMMRREWDARRLVGLLSFLAIVLALAVSGTRGGWLAVIAAAVPFYVLLCLSRRYRRQLLFFGGLAALLAAIVLFVPNPLLRVRFNVSQRLMASEEITERFYYWIIAIEMLKEHPWLGVGYMNFNVHFWPTAEIFQQGPYGHLFRYVLTENIGGVLPGHTHNDFLQIAAETGVFGIMSWLGIWSVLLCQAWEKARASQHGDHRGLLMAAAFLASFVAAGVDALFNFPVHLPVSGLLFWCSLGMWIVFRAIPCSPAQVLPAEATPGASPPNPAQAGRNPKKKQT